MQFLTNGGDMTLEEIGHHLREARLRTGHSQQQLAASVGMSRATVSALESGRCAELGVRKLTALLEQVGLDLFAAPRSARPTLDDLRSERRDDLQRLTPK